MIRRLKTATLRQVSGPSLENTPSPLREGHPERRAAVVSNFTPRVDRAVRNHLATLSPNTAHAFQTELEIALGRRAEAPNALEGFVLEATRVVDSVGYLRDVSVLADLRELSSDSVRALGRKAALGQLDPGWLLDSKLDLDFINFMAQDPFTPWYALRRAGELPAPKRQRWANLVLPGIAGEFVAKRVLSEELAPYEIQTRQDRMRGARADFVIASPDGRLAHPVEVKAWSSARWKRAMDAYESAQNDSSGKAITHLIEQLRSLDAQTGCRPVLAMVEVAEELRERIVHFIDGHAPGTMIVPLPRSEFELRLSQLKSAFAPR